MDHRGFGLPSVSCLAFWRQIPNEGGLKRMLVSPGFVIRLFKNVKCRLFYCSTRTSRALLLDGRRRVHGALLLIPPLKELDSRSLVRDGFPIDQVARGAALQDIQHGCWVVLKVAVEWHLGRVRQDE